MPHRLPTPTPPLDELNAMQRCARLIERLDPAAQRRAVQYLHDRYGTEPEPPAEED